MTLSTSFPTQDSAGQSITDTRRVFAGLVVGSAAGVPRWGILPNHTNPIVTGRASMGYDVGPFVAATGRQAGGVELVANDGTMTVATDAAPNANSRIDIIYVQCRFTSYTDSANTPVLGVARGVPNASPVAPSIPAGALALASAVVTSADLTTSTVVITQIAPYTAMEGGTVLLRNQAEQDAWAPHAGSEAYRLDLGKRAVRVGGAWGLEASPSIAPTSGVAIDAETVISRDAYGQVSGYLAATTTGGGSWSAAGLVGVLPAGFRPTSSISFLHRSYTAAFANTVNLGRIDPNGEIWVNLVAAAGQTIARGPFFFKAAA
ncbi:hypothetical protein [Microbacterium binotii]|uniref:Minor tail protein n=1 Tax=Microbacterium binotii TaxID=462710 RepID=A0ABN3PG30_9MICO